MRTLALTIVLTIGALIVPGCDAGNTPASDAQKTPAQIKKEAQGLSASGIENVMARYNDEIKNMQQKIKAIDPNALGSMKVKDILGEEGQKAIEGSRELFKELKQLKDRLTIYTKELSSRK